MPPVSEVELSSVPGEVGNGQLLSRDECICPVCLEIFLEPVTLPCDHTLCKPCFLDTVDKASMCCPLCRKRVSTWARKNSRNKTLVNDELWRRVQATFPQQCQRRLSGKEEEEEEFEVFLPKVAQPGEVRREYEDQIRKLAEEKRALEEAESRASEEYIQRLLTEEEERLAEERRNQEERQLEVDERLARMLSEELNSSPISESQRNGRQNEATSAKKKPKAVVGDIEKFLAPIPTKHASHLSSTSTRMSNKENILHRPFSHAASKQPADSPPPRLDYYGAESCRPSPHTTASLCPSAVQSPSSSSQDGGRGLVYLQSNGSPTKSSKRKSSDTDLKSEEAAIAKRPCPSSSSLLSDPGDPPGDPPVQDVKEGQLLKALTQHEEALFSRWQQEEEDRKMALRLQKELYKEERQKATERSKGSANPYLLRQKANAVEQARDGASPSTSPSTSSSFNQELLTPCKPNKVSSSFNSGSAKKGKGKKEKSPAGRATAEQRQSCASTLSIPGKPLYKGSKQATLTDMFPSLGN